MVVFHCKPIDGFAFKIYPCHLCISKLTIGLRISMRRFFILDILTSSNSFNKLKY